VKQHIGGRADITVAPIGDPDIDLAVILCGCLRACADKDETRGLARRYVTIAGGSLAGTPQNEDRLATLLVAEIDRFSPQQGD
jgi:hypothetical protein